MSCWSLEMSGEFYVRSCCSQLGFNHSLRMEVGMKIRQFRARVMVFSRQHENSGNWYGITGGDLNYQTD